MINSNLSFFLDIDPPTTTVQEKKIVVKDGKPIFYYPTKVKEARRVLMEALQPNTPLEPLEGAIELEVNWMFPATKTHPSGTWRVTRPDTDNLEKGLKDIMTLCGFWKDDAQVVMETITKSWSDTPGIRIRIREF